MKSLFSNLNMLLYLFNYLFISYFTLRIEKNVNYVRMLKRAAH